MYGRDINIAKEGKTGKKQIILRIINREEFKPKIPPAPA
jgi:hypothetical protein